MLSFLKNGFFFLAQKSDFFSKVSDINKEKLISLFSFFLPKKVVYILKKNLKTSYENQQRETSFFVFQKQQNHKAKTKPNVTLIFLSRCSICILI